MSPTSTDVPLPKLVRRSPGEKAAANPQSAHLAIAAFCYHDCNQEKAPNSHTTKLAIKECKNNTCSLWPKRPFQKITGGNCKPKKATP